jgi:hypothetical protein
MDSGSTDFVPEPMWQTATVRGNATSSTLYLFAEAGGTEFLIDDIQLVNETTGVPVAVPNPGFDTAISPWAPTGNHAGSRWSRAAGGTIYDEPALHLIAGGVGTGSANSVRLELPAGTLTNGVPYVLTFRYFYLAGEYALVARLSNSTPSNGLYWRLGGVSSALNSAGAANIARRSAVPPFVRSVNHFPLEPTSSEPVRVYAQVDGSPTEVRLHTTTQTFPLRDDGASGDGAAGDGVWGVTLPARPHHTVVAFTIEAVSGAESRISPLRTDPQEAHGYYVNDYQPFSPLPIVHMILPTTSPRSWIAALDCSVYQTCSLAVQGRLYYNVGIRRRGGSVCGDGAVIKKYLKVRFNKGHEFRVRGQEDPPHKNLNFQSMYTDKALIRERVAWDLFGEMGTANCTHDFVRMHGNGDYFGLYAAMERPDERYLARNGVFDGGNLYKATASREECNGTYEKKTNEDGDFTDLRDFLCDMHATPAANLRAYFQQTVDEDNVIDYQASQMLVNNADYPHKNHYLYHDTSRGRWMVFTWDVDLVYGKIWNGSFGGVLHDRMDNPGLSPWYTTNVRGGGTGNHLLDKFFSQSGTYYRRAYITRLWDALQEKYTIDFYEGRILEHRALILEEQEEDIAEWGRSPATADDPTAPAEFEPNLDRVREHIAIRRDYLINYLRTTEGFAGHDSLKITEIMYNPFGADDTEYLEVWNNSGRNIDVSGWTIEGLGELDVFTFEPGTLINENQIFIVAKDPAAFASRYGVVARVFGPFSGSLTNGGEELRIKDDGPEYPATVEYVHYRTDGDWPVLANGFGHSLELTDVSPTRDNDLGVYWQASSLASGTPGIIAGVSSDIPFFRRADPNGDGLTDVSDPFFLLRYLFDEGQDPLCFESADVDASGVVGMDDPLDLLNYLFLNGTPPAAPFASCGPEDTGNALTCDVYPHCS